MVVGQFVMDMKRLAGFCCTLMLVAASVCPLLAAAENSAEAVGTVIFLAGEGRSERDGESRLLALGDPVYTGDQLSTNQQGYLHVRFVDDGLISVRPDSLVTIQVYQFNPDDAAQSRVRIELDKGTMRSATGLVGARNKEAFRINTPVSAIGIRGTDFVVYATEELARLSVNEGGVVMAPFSTDCLVDTFVPCGGEASAELFATVAKALLEVRAGEGYALVTSDGPTPDEINPPHPEESALFENLITRARGVIQRKVGLSAPGAESYEDGLETARRYVGEVPLVQEAYELGERESDLPFVSDRQLVDEPAFVWGRWSSYSIQSESAQSIASIRNQRDYAVLQRVFAMFEDTPESRVMPETGRATFSLNSYEAYVKRGNNLESAGISNPALVVDFAQAEFATRMDVHAASLPGVVTVLGAGELTSEGFFHSGKNSPAKIDGVLSADLLQAGMLFEYQVSPGVEAVGATHWVDSLSLGKSVSKSSLY